MAGQSRVMWIEPDGFLEEGGTCFWFPQPHHCLPKLENCAGVTAVERDRRLELHLRLAQAVLQSPEYPHRNMRHRAVRIALESFEEQLFGPCLILFAQSCSIRSLYCQARLLRCRFAHRRIAGRPRARARNPSEPLAALPWNPAGNTRPTRA